MRVHEGKSGTTARSCNRGLNFLSVVEQIKTDRGHERLSWSFGVQITPSANEMLKYHKITTSQTDCLYGDRTES